jgi:hypothetical protein
MKFGGLRSAVRGSAALTVCAAALVTGSAAASAASSSGTASGPSYRCAVSLNGKIEYTETSQVPLSIKAVGKHVVGQTDGITLSAASAGPFPTDSAFRFRGSLPVTGAQHSTVSFSDRRTPGISNAAFRVSGNLSLTRPGTTLIYYPQAFTLTTYDPNGGGVVAFSCTRTTRPAVGLTLKVTASVR